MKIGDIKKVINESLGLNEENNINESYIARPKHYDLKTEMLLSKTKEAHKELYQSYIERLNFVNSKLDILNKGEANSNNSEFRSLKKDEAYLLNAVYLHELYFSNISDPYSEISKDSYAHMRLTRDFGTFDDWQKDFLACALSARQGWVVTAISTYRKAYTNFIIDEHDFGVLVGNYPVIVLDCWEHARRDYLNNKKDYVIAMMRELNWNVIEERFKRADAILSIIQ